MQKHQYEIYYLRKRGGNRVRYLLEIQHGRDLETWYLEAGRHLGASEADTEVGVI